MAQSVPPAGQSGLPGSLRSVAPSEGSGGAYRDVIVETLRQEIVDEVIPVGAQLYERELSVRFGVSRVPVREAIITLAGDGLVEMRPRVGAFVAPLTLRHVRETFEIRAMLEPAAARLCALRATDVQIQRLKHLELEARAAQESHDFLRGSTANADFHELLFETSGNEILHMMVRPLMGITRRLFRRTIVDHESMMWGDHEAITKAIALGDADRAARLTAEHLEHTRAHTFDIFSSEETG